MTLTLFLQSYVYAEVEFKAQVDKNKLASDELLTYKLVITTDEKNIPQPQFPRFEGFNIVSQAESTTISFAKSSTKNTVIYVFVLAPNDPGEFKIESSRLKSKDKTYQTESFEIEVTPGNTKPQPRLRQKPSKPGDIQPETETEQPQVIL